MHRPHKHGKVSSRQRRRKAHQTKLHQLRMARAVNNLLTSVTPR